MSDCPCLNWHQVYWHRGMDCQRGVDGLWGPPFCRFIQNLNSDVCIAKNFMNESGVADEMCYVSAECSGSLFPFPQQKTCRSGKDRLLSEMNVSEVLSVATKNKVDAGVMAGFGSLYVNRLTNNVSMEEIQKYKATGTPTFIWSMIDLKADRLHIKGDEVYKHYHNGGHWETKCLEGCPPPHSRDSRASVFRRVARRLR